MKKPITNSLLFKLLIADIIISLLVAGALAWLGVFSYDIAQKASKNASSVRATAITAFKECTDLNKLKATEQKFFVIIPPPHPSVALQRYLFNLIAQANIAFAQQKCVDP